MRRSPGAAGQLLPIPARRGVPARYSTTPAPAAPTPSNCAAKVRELTAADKEQRSKHAAEIRDLRATVRTYANHIQTLTLHLSQLQDDNQRLTARLQHAGDNITPLNQT